MIEGFALVAILLFYLAPLMCAVGILASILKLIRGGGSRFRGSLAAYAAGALCWLPLYVPGSPVDGNPLFLALLLGSYALVFFGIWLSLRFSDSPASS